MCYFKFIGVAARVFQVDWQMQLLKSNKQPEKEHRWNFPITSGV